MSTFDTPVPPRRGSPSALGAGLQTPPSSGPEVSPAEPLATPIEPEADFSTSQKVAEIEAPAATQTEHSQEDAPKLQNEPNDLPKPPKAADYPQHPRGQIQTLALLILAALALLILLGLMALAPASAARAQESPAFQAAIDDEATVKTQAPIEPAPDFSTSQKVPEIGASAVTQVEKYHEEAAAVRNEPNGLPPSQIASPFSTRAARRGRCRFATRSQGTRRGAPTREWSDRAGPFSEAR